MKKATIKFILDINVEVFEEDFDNDDPREWTKQLRRMFEEHSTINMNGFFNERPYNVRAKLIKIGSVE